MIQEMTWDQLLGWYEYYSVEPFGEERADLRLGIMASLFVNANSDTSKSGVARPEDFIPKFDALLEDHPRQKVSQSWNDVKEMAIALAGRELKSNG